MMTEITCDKCHGTGKVQINEQPCEASIVIDHGDGFLETLSCYAVRPHPGRLHVTVAYPPCDDCGGYDEHRSGCGRIGEETGDEGEYGWLNDGEQRSTDLVLIRLAPPLSTDWMNEFGPRSR